MVERSSSAGRDDRVRIDRIPVDPLTRDEVSQRIHEAVRGSNPAAFHVVTVNAQYVELARRDAEFAALIDRADLSIADGVPLIWASWLLGKNIPERINGTDLMVRLCMEAARDGMTVYLMGGLPGAGQRAGETLQRDYPGLIVAGVDCPPFGFMDNPAEVEAVDRRIAAARPDLLFVALGAPKQDYWIQRHIGLPAKVMIGVGGSFELIAGITKRAPLLFQKLGCEWLWRLLLEPRRLLKRYAVGNTMFVYLVVRQWWKGLYEGRRQRAVP